MTTTASIHGRLDTAPFAALLEAERARIGASLAELEAERRGLVSSSDADREDDPDDGGGEGSTRAAELARVETLRDRLEVRREEVEAALGRIAQGTYGMCRSCEGSIGEARLEAMPEVTECVECKRAPVWARRPLRPYGGA